MKYLLSIIGPTGIGKTPISIFLAKKLNTEIISCDSRQFYYELKIGTAYPKIQDLNLIKHHLIGHKNIHELYTVGDFEKDANKIINKLFLKYNIIIMVGGSGLYEKAVVEGLNNIPKISKNIVNNWNNIFQKKGIFYLQQELKNKDYTAYNNIDILNPRRLIRALSVIEATNKKYSYFHNIKKHNKNFVVLRIGLILERNKIYESINNRTDIMMNMGLLDEAKKFFHYKKLNALQTIGYQEIFSFLEGKISLTDSIKNIKKNTRNYAKRQITWYKKYNNIFWFNPNYKEKILKFIIKKINIKY